MLNIGIFGGSGYGGAELLRLLLPHPNVQIALITANEHAGKSVAEVHRNLYGLTDLHFAKAPDDLQELSELDCLILTLPHGQAMEIIPRVPKNVKAIDLSGDFRLSDREEFERYYGFEHTAMQVQSEFVYGLTELNREAIANARLVANPGCFATATLLGLAPLVSKNLLSGAVVVDAKTGSSGSGAKAAANTHHPQRMTSFYAYKPFAHQHVPEIDEALRSIGDWNTDMVFMTHSLPVARGIFASIYEGERDLLAVAEIEMPVPDVHVAVADARRLDAQQHLLALGLGIGVVARFERLAPFDDLHRTHAGVLQYLRLWGSARFPLRGERQIQFHAVMHHFRRDAPAFAALKADQAITFHCSQRPRQIGFGLSRDRGQLIERARRLLADDTQQLAITGRQDLGERFGRGEPDLRLVGGNAPLAARHRHGARLHLLVAGDADLQGRHGITPLSRNTASTVLQKSASSVAASRYS